MVKTVDFPLSSTHCEPERCAGLAVKGFMWTADRAITDEWLCSQTFRRCCDNPRMSPSNMLLSTEGCFFFPRQACLTHRHLQFRFIPRLLLRRLRCRLQGWRRPRRRFKFCGGLQLIHQRPLTIKCASANWSGIVLPLGIACSFIHLVRFPFSQWSSCLWLWKWRASIVCQPDIQLPPRVPYVVVKSLSVVPCSTIF